MSKLPNKVYVALQDYENSDPGLVVDENPENLSIPDDIRVVGEYRLVRKVKLVNKTEVR